MRKRAEHQDGKVMDMQRQALLEGADGRVTTQGNSKGQ